MSPLKFHDDGDHLHARRSDINGPRPSPLKINRGSHVIHKTSSSSINHGMTMQHEHKKQPNQPIIIYTQSPKIIHTQPKDFMASVQKLTGLSNSSYQYDHIEIQKVDGEDNVRNCEPCMSSHDDNESCSPPTDENHVACGGGCVEDVQVTSSSAVNYANQFFADVPLFTPNSAYFFCSPQAIYRYPESTNNTDNSPSILDS